MKSLIYVKPLGFLKIQEDDLKRYITEISMGNEAALEQFYDEYGRLLLALIFSIVKNREAAEEALQDVLMAIVRHNTDGLNHRGQLFHQLIQIRTESILMQIVTMEPLYTKTSAEIMELFSALNKDGKTVIIITHDSGVAGACKRRIEISDGKLLTDK